MRRLKGAERPVWPLARRMRFVRPQAASVIPFEGREEQLIMEIRPRLVFKGWDHGSESLEVYAARVPGWRDELAMDVIEILRIPRLGSFSTTARPAAITRAPLRDST